MNSTTPATGLGDGLDHSNRQGMFLAVIITFTVISTLMVLLRVYTRAVIVRSFGKGEPVNWCLFFCGSNLADFSGKDDWAIIATMVSPLHDTWRNHCGISNYFSRSWWSPSVLSVVFVRLIAPKNVNNSFLTVTDVHYGFLGYHVWDFTLSPERKLIYRKVSQYMTEGGLINHS